MLSRTWLTHGEAQLLEADLCRITAALAENEAALAEKEAALAAAK